MLREEEIARGSLPHGRDLSPTPSFPRPITSCSPMPKPIPLEDVCAKQEHLIAMTKIKHFNRTQAVFQQLKYFLEPAIFIEVWNLALPSRLACASGCGIGADRPGSTHRNVLVLEESGEVNKGSLSSGAGTRRRHTFRSSARGTSLWCLACGARRAWCFCSETKLTELDLGHS